MTPIPNLNVALDQCEAAKHTARQALVQHLNVWAMELTQGRYNRCEFRLAPIGLTIISASGRDYHLTNDSAYHLNEIPAISKYWNELLASFHEVTGYSTIEFEAHECFTIRGPHATK